MPGGLGFSQPLPRLVLKPDAFFQLSLSSVVLTIFLYLWLLLQQGWRKKWNRKLLLKFSRSGWELHVNERLHYTWSCHLAHAARYALALFAPAWLARAVYCIQAWRGISSRRSNFNPKRAGLFVYLMAGGGGGFRPPPFRSRPRSANKFWNLART